MTAHELVAICDACTKPIADGEGVIWIDYGQIDQHEKAVRAWRQEQKEKTPPGLLVTSTFSDIMKYPPAVRWNVHHAACDPDPDAGAYSIGVHQMRTWGDLVHWTAHLMEKSWLSNTDWRKLLDGATSTTGGRITPVVAPKINA